MEFPLEVIQIKWDGPIAIDELQRLTNTSMDYGIYQIYGKHPVYGSSVLLYIGKADYQTFGKRISQENWLDTNDSQRIEVYAGRLAGEKQPSEEEWSRQISLAEQLLIYVHKPAYNAKNLNAIDDKSLQNIHVLNWGAHRDLFPEISGLRWTTRLDGLKYEIFKIE